MIGTQSTTRSLTWGARTYIMAVLNVTPDSFSGDGTLDADTSVERALTFVNQGADIIDIGGESTRPGFVPVDAASEIARVLPVISGLRARTCAMISIDTRKSEVFEKVKTDVDFFNSIAGFDESIILASVEASIPVVLMHNGNELECRSDAGANENGVVESVLRYLDKSAAIAIKMGCRPENVILDPGIGFGKSPEQNLSLLRSLGRIKSLGFPVLVGTSRKSTLGKVTGRPVDERVFATAATVALAIAGGADIVRVHDIEAMSDVVRMSDAIVRGWEGDRW